MANHPNRSPQIQYQITPHSRRAGDFCVRIKANNDAALAKAKAVMVGEGWDNPGWYAEGRVFDCSTSNSASGHRAIAALVRAGAVEAAKLPTPKVRDGVTV